MWCPPLEGLEKCVSRAVSILIAQLMLHWLPQQAGTAAALQHEAIAAAFEQQAAKMQVCSLKT